MKTFIMITAILMMAGCSTYIASRPFPLEVADPVSVRECRLVGKIPGPYGYSFWGPPPVLGDFKYRSALIAKDAGATHIFWREPVMGYYGQTQVVAYAFDCTGVSMPEYYGDSVMY
jgi:hypothetical protein